MGVNVDWGMKVLVVEFVGVLVKVAVEVFVFE